MYGFWLPNDPRGSWSNFVGAWELLPFGRATKTESRRSVANTKHDRTRRSDAKTALKYPPVHLNGRQARAIGRGFAGYVECAGITVWACSILPRHVHMVIARHAFNVEYVINQLKGRATQQMIAEGIHPLSQFQLSNERVPNCWSRGQWKVFLNTPQDVRRAIRYVEVNPSKEALPPQRWSITRPFLA
jgi:REP element-mobilizing transposase RayT